SYRSNLIEKPQAILANKIDMPGSEEKLEQLKEQLPAHTEVVEISPYTQTNLNKLLYQIADKLQTIQDERQEDDEITIRHEEKEAPFKITRSDDGAYVLSGPKIERIFNATDFTYDESVQRFARQVRHLGVDDELRKRGAKDGDTIRILDFEFEFIE